MVVVAALLLACSTPILYLLSSSSRSQEQNFRRTYAHYIAKRVLEFASARANRQGFNSIAVHSEFLSPVESDSGPVSPYFRLFGVKGQSITNQGDPRFFKILSKFKLRFTLDRVEGQSANSSLRNGLVEVEWERADGLGRSSLTLQTILSDVSRL